MGNWEGGRIRNYSGYKASEGDVIVYRSCAPDAVSGIHRRIPDRGLLWCLIPPGAQGVVVAPGGETTDVLVVTDAIERAAPRGSKSIPQFLDD